MKEHLNLYNQYQESKKHKKVSLEDRISFEIMELLEELPELKDASNEDKEMLLEFFADIVREEVRNEKEGKI